MSAGNGSGHRVAHDALALWRMPMMSAAGMGLCRSCDEAALQLHNERRAMAETTPRIGRRRRGTPAPAHAHRTLSFAARSLAVAIALLWYDCAFAVETEVLLLRGWFGVFSTGIDGLAAELKANGIKTQVSSYSSNLALPIFSPDDEIILCLNV